MTVNVGGGIIWFPIPAFGLNAEVGMLGFSTHEVDGGDKTTSIGLLLDPAVNFSICWFPGRE